MQWFDALADRRWLVLTGAGVSTDSGIPDYRGPGSTARQPMTFSDFSRSFQGRQHYWARSHVGWTRMHDASPNRTHLALAGLAADDRLTGLITQNVDGLHTAAGHPDVVDLHGRIDRVVCLDCRRTSRRDRLQDRLTMLNPGWADQDAPVAPDGDVAIEVTDGFRIADCEACGGVLKPDVVFFGESVPKPVVAHCFDLVDRAEALVVLGSSLHVMSGLRFVKAAAKRGIPVVIINRGTTRGDDLATVKLDAGCAETLAQLPSTGYPRRRMRTVSGSASSTVSTSSPSLSAKSVTT